MSTSVIDQTNIVSFAKRLLALSPPASAEQALLSLPWLDLTVRASGVGQAAMVRRALVNDPIYAQSPQQKLVVSVIDRLASPDIPHATWSPSLGFGDFIHTLEAGELAGAYDRDYGTWQFLSNTHSLGIQTLQSPGHSPPWETSFPLRNFLHWAYQAQGMRLVHAATLGFDGRGVILAGAGGSGKSGTTLAGVTQGLTSVGDDYVCVRQTNDGAYAYPVIRLMKQDPVGLARVGIDPKEQSLGEVNWQGKYEFDFAALVPQAKAQCLKLEAILVPRIADVARSRISAVPMREAIFGLLPNNLQQLPGGYRQGVAFVSALVRRLPVYQIELSSNAEDIAEAITDFIDGVRP